MDFIVIALAAFAASALTLYSGFGLGTVLLPAFTLFFPVPAAVAATGAVHLLNNLFKGGMLWRRADWATVARFGVPAIPAAVLGAWLLNLLGETPRLFTWSGAGRVFGPTGAELSIGLLMIAFAVLELQPWFQKLAAPRGLMPLGGLVTGFFGGLTGHQGALRSMFLLKGGLAPERFIATGVILAVLVDVSRLPTYAAGFGAAGGLSAHAWALVATGTLSAFAGAWLGARYLRKATVGVVRVIVAGLMIVIGAGLAAGLLGS